LSGNNSIADRSEFGVKQKQMTTPVVQIQGLTKDYEVGFWRKRRLRALDGLTLTVNRGEIFGFLGANGAGKTTTLKLLMRLIFPTAGSARILDHDISDIAMHRRIGYLPENPYFYDYLTAREFLEYCGEIFGCSKAERKRRAELLMARVNLDEKRWDIQLRKFSKGMLQRVGLTQALINDPEVIFLDEPMSGLDPVGRREVRDLIASLRDEGKTVFMCSHILSDIEVLCDRVAILKRGRLAQVGYLDELRQRTDDPERMELLATGADAATLIKYLEGTDVTPTARGLRIEIAAEAEIETVLAALRQAGGKLVSVQPIKQSLEELFLDEPSTSKMDQG
jgi:ABC-2 type transport system ATP-binding protein